MDKNDAIPDKESSGTSGFRCSCDCDTPWLLAVAAAGDTGPINANDRAAVGAFSLHVSIERILKHVTVGIAGPI